MPSPRKEGGSSLLAAMIALAVILLLVAAAIGFTGTNRDAAAAKNRGDQVAACAAAGKKYLLSRLRVFNIRPNDLTLSEDLPEEAGVTPTRVITGHYGDTTAQTTIVAVRPGTVASSQVKMRDLSNAAPGKATLGGTHYRAVVTCRDPGGRESELEFTFQYGL